MDGGHGHFAWPSLNNHSMVQKHEFVEMLKDHAMDLFRVEESPFVSFLEEESSTFAAQRGYSV